MTEPEARTNPETPVAAATGPKPDSTLTPHEALTHYVTMWKTSVEVQQHFNDIEWRIRALALSVATFALGAAGLAAKDGTTIGPFSLGAAVLVLGLVLWYAFAFVDHRWYHLLKAAVAEGTEFEKAIGKYLPEAHMTAGITERSPQEINWLMALLAAPNGSTVKDGVRVMHSDHKLHWFYRVGSLVFVLGAVLLQLGVWFPKQAAPAQPIMVQVQTQSPIIPSTPTPTRTP